MASQYGRRTVAQVKPILSLSREDARRRAINLYRDWYRQIPGWFSFTIIHKEKL